MEYARARQWIARIQMGARVGHSGDIAPQRRVRGRSDVSRPPQSKPVGNVNPVDEYKVTTHTHTEFINIDLLVQGSIDKSGVTTGEVRVFVPHTTAGITINENADPDVLADMELILNRVAPWEGGYAHAEGNAAAHVKASMMGFSVSVFVQNGQLAFGTWQSIYLCEFDGPRTRRIWVKVLRDP